MMRLHEKFLLTDYESKKDFPEVNYRHLIETPEVHILKNRFVFLGLVPILIF